MMKSPMLALAAIAGLGPLSAYAVEQSDFRRLTQPDNHVEVGIRSVSEGSDRFGRYNALYQDGIFLVLGLEYLVRPRFDEPAPMAFSISARDLGLGNRQVVLRMGRQGRFGLEAGYHERRFRGGHGLVTIYDRENRADLRLPADWQPAANTSGMNLQLSDLHEFSLAQRRREARLAASAVPAERWQLSAQVRQEDRDGTSMLAGLFGNSGGNPRAAFLPVPVDYRTRLFDLNLDYGDRRRQFRLAYHGSLFSNNEPQLAFANPFSTIGGWAPGSGYPEGHGALALPPANQFHQLSLATGWQLRPALHLSGQVATGRMTQNEPLLAYTANPMLAQAIVQPLPSVSLDGRIDTTAVHLRLSGRNLSRLTWNLSYRLDDRDNRTERREWVYVGGDSQLQDTSPTSSRRRYNLPYDYRHQRLRLDGQWRLDERTRLGSAIQRGRSERSFSARDRVDETLLELSARHRAGQRLQLGAQMLWADRDGSRYDGAAGFLAGHDPGYIDTLAGQWASLPALRMLHLADRRRQRQALSANLTPHQHWAISLEAAHAVDDYRNTEIGLTESRQEALSGTLTWAPSRELSAHAFYSWERLASDQAGFSFRGGANRLIDIADPERSWEVDHRDRIDTLGAGLQRYLLDRRLQLQLDLVHAQARARQQVTTGTALTAEPLPTVSNRLDSIMFRASYRLSDPLSLHFRYWFERFRSDDWAFDGVGPDQLANIILPGESADNYRVHIVLLSLRYQL
ncbi:MAG: MtrB/PioB family decaheme-associated outer membrane protein [Wenzhouxiangellaceae bacterium]|nr:MAG: MtrB/PioB family decaheme-associated outer membrane protein [Wenzhouxiangellaceae bacterium]